MLLGKTKMVALLSVEDVNSRLPLVRCIMADVVDLYRDLQLRRKRLQSLRERYPSSPPGDSIYEQEVVQMEDELARDEIRMEGFEKELQQIGGSLSDPERGAVDFIGEISGERVKYCWCLGESELAYWHGSVCAESERRPLLHEAEFSSGAEFRGQSF